MSAPCPRPSLCRGRRVYGQDYRYDCDWLQCPVLYGDDECAYRLPDDDPNPLDELPPNGIDPVTGASIAG